MLQDIQIDDKVGRSRSPADSTPRKIGLFMNLRDANSYVSSSYPFQGILIELGDAAGTWDQAGVSVNSLTKGDCFWAGPKYEGTELAVGYNVWCGDDTYTTGNIRGYNCLMYSKGIGVNVETRDPIDASARLAKFLMDEGTVSTMIDIYAKGGTADVYDTSLLSLYQEVATFSGVGINMNFAVTGGSFSGDFIKCAKNGTVKFQVNNAGLLQVANNLEWYGGIGRLRVTDSQPVVEKVASGGTLYLWNSNDGVGLKLDFDNTDAVLSGIDLDINSRYIDGWNTAATCSEANKQYIKVKVGGVIKRVPFFDDADA